MNSINYLSRGSSVHHNRTAMNCRIEQHAFEKAARAPLGGNTLVVMQPPQPHCHMDSFTRAMGTINSALGGFLTGLGLTSGQSTPAGGICMPMGGGMSPLGGFPGMFGGCGSPMSMNGSIFGMNNGGWC